MRLRIPLTGATLATASEDGNVFLWDLATGNLPAISGHLGRVSALAFSPDGATLASHSAAYDGVVNIWDAATGRMGRSPLPGTDSVGSFRYPFRPTGRTLASASQDRTVRLWDLDTHRRINTFRHTFQVGSVSFSPDGTTLASGDFEGFVHLWDAKTATKMDRLTGLNKWVRSLLFSPDGATLAAGSGRRRDQAVGRGDAVPPPATWKGILNGFSPWPFHGTGATLGYRFARRYRQGVGPGDGLSQRHAGSKVGRLRGILPRQDRCSPPERRKAWSGYTTCPRAKLSLSLKGTITYVTSVMFSPDGSRLASGSYDGTMLLWDLAPYRVSQTPDPDFNGDGAVDFADFIQFAAKFGLSLGDLGYSTLYDLDDDGTIGFGDFVIFAKDFGNE